MATQLHETEFNMLCLTRNVHESVIIQSSDGPIEVVINKIKGNQVQVGFIADPRVSIIREELYKPTPKPFEFY